MGSLVGIERRARRARNRKALYEQLVSILQGVNRICRYNFMLAQEIGYLGLVKSYVQMLRVLYTVPNTRFLLAILNV